MAKVRIKGTSEVADRTLAVRMEKPPGFSFEAGQFVELTLMDPPETDAEGNSRAFTLASAPHEAELVVATRLRDTAFKRVLKTLKAGAEVDLDGPFGSFTLHRDGSRPAVFLAGGIGITPFRSMALQATKDALSQRLFLFYSNRRPENAAFLAELQALETQNSRFTCIATMTDVQPSSQSWQGHRGRIDQALIERWVDSTTSPIYYIAGPAGMVRAMQGLLRSSGVATEDIRAEEFSGY
ncbi:MAG TPA: FAD-dependent oxidoreductase [Terriglobales bacterium]|nr:FAD-dependent oxidoreductase [Terriglobales bacterium]